MEITASVRIAQKPTSARGVIRFRRRHSRINPATPEGADGRGTFAEMGMVKLV
jgi:hypothetical protein